MASDLAAMFPEMDCNELIYADFIKTRIQRNGGSLKFQHITGQLSQLEHNVRSAIGASPKELMLFLKKYDCLFAVDDGLVSLKKFSGKKETPNPPKDINVKDQSERESKFPKIINDVPGIVIKVLPTYGFIAIKEPVKTSVYFTPSCFNDSNKTLLTDLQIVAGKKVCLNAKIGNIDFESKYRATKVWFPKNVENEVLHPEGFHPKVPKTRATGLYDADTSEGSGVIQKIFDTYGFIIIDGDQNNTVFFHKNRVCNVENIQDLSKIFRPGDLVEYKAVRSQKQHLKVRWEATKVWIRKKGKFKSKENVESATSDYESYSSRSKTSKPQRVSDPSCINGKKAKSKLGLDSKELSNVVGKIYPNTKGTVIKFGEKDSQLADADSCLFYLHKVKVEDVSWEFSDGDVVTFDGIKIKSPPGFKALLAWVGEKPNVVPIPLGDFSGESDEDIEDVSENESSFSKTSNTSALSETNLGLSKNKRPNLYNSASSLVSNSSKKSQNRSRSRAEEYRKHSNYNDNSYSASEDSSKKSFNRSRADERQQHSNYNNNSSHSVSRSSSKKSYNRSRSRADESQRHSNYNNNSSHSVSRSSSKKSYNRSRSRVDERKRCTNYNEDDSYSISSNSKSSQHSGFSGVRQRRSKSKNSGFKKNYKSDSVNSSHSHLTNCRSKASSVESINSLSSEMKNKLKPNPDLFKSWADTPYPDGDEEVDKIHLKAHGREGILRKNYKYSDGDISSGKSSPCSDEINKQVENVTDNLACEKDLNVSNKVSNENDQVSSTFQSRYAEIFLSDDDFTDALEEVKENIIVNNANDSSEDADSQTQEEEAPESYIKRFRDLNGTVKKVFCRYAEIESEKLKKVGTFFWSDMYHNGVPVPDKFDDLKEVLSPSQTVKFNCFEIVDDVGTYFVKVTVAWKGSKPKITEMTPDEFIAQNDIRFSGNEISTVEDQVKSSCSESMRPLNAESIAAPRKFLTVADMSDDSSDEENQPDPPEDLEVIPLKEDAHSHLKAEEYMDLRENVLSNSESMDIPQLTHAVSKMLESSKSSQIDSDVVASDLVNLILSRAEAMKNLSCQANSISSTQVNQESVEANKKSNITDSYAQTIITGKIFSESIFTR